MYWQKRRLKLSILMYWQPWLNISIFSQAMTGWMESVCAQPFSDLKSGLWLWHSRTFTEWSWCSFVTLAVCIGSLSCWKTGAEPEHSGACYNQGYVAAFIFPSTLTRLPILTAKKHLQSMMSPMTHCNQATEFNLYFIRTENYSSIFESPLGAFGQTPSGCPLASLSWSVGELLSNKECV